MALILCATDLSAASDAAITAAAALSRGMGARLELLHVLHVPPGLPTELMANAAFEELMAGAKSALARRAGQLSAQGFDVVTSFETGLVDERIVARAREVDAELVVVGTHARHGIARAMLGSVAERTMRWAHCPVLVVPPSTATRLGAWKAGERRLKILAGVDFSPASDAALAWLSRLVARVRCDLRLLHVYWPPREHERLGLERPDPFDPDPVVSQVLARDIRRHVAGQVGRSDMPVHVRPFWGAGENPLIWEAESNGVDLLLLGTSQAGRDSTALGTVRDARLPVLCVPAGTAPLTVPSRKTLPPIRQVLVTTDFSALGNAAIPEAYRLLARSGGTVVLAHVVEPTTPGLTPETRKEIEACLLALVPEGIDANRIHTGTFVAESTDAGEAIVQAIRRLGPDTVVLSSHGRSGIGRALRGSVAEQVMRGSPRPVLVVPPPERATQ